MPTAGPGQVLRAYRGGVGVTYTAGDNPVLVFTPPPPGTRGNPVLVGTTAHLAAAGLLPSLPTATGRAEGTNEEANARWVLPTPAWGSPGSLVRTPRCLVVVCPDMATGASPTNDLPEVTFQTALADAVEGGAAELAARGVSVLVVKVYYGFWPGGRAAPLLGPCVLLDGTGTFQGYGSAAIPVSSSLVATTDPTVTGGDVYWAFAGGAFPFDVGVYSNTYQKTATNATPSVDLPAGFVAWGSPGNTSENSPFFPFTDVFNIVHQQIIYDQILQRDLGHLLPVARRCRKFRFRFVTTPMPYTFGTPEVTLSGDDGTFTGRFPDDLDVGFIRGDGADAGGSLLADAKTFFGIA